MYIHGFISYYCRGFDVVRRMQKQPGAMKGGGFIGGAKNYIHIDSFLRLSVQDTETVLRELPNYANAK